MADNIGQVASAFIGLEADIRSFSDSLKAATPALERIAAETGKKIDSAITKQLTFAKVGEQFKAFGQQAQNLGRALTVGVTAPLVGLGTLALKAGSDFETAFTGVRKTVNATGPQLETLRNQLLEMSREIPVTAVELANVAEAAGQLGVKTEHIQKFTDTMVKLGVATNLTSEEAATGLAKLSNITGFAQEDVDKLGSALVALGNDGASTEKDILEMSLRIAGLGPILGLTDGQILGFASALSSVGIQAELGGSAITRVFQTIATQVETGGDKLQVFADVVKKSSADFAQGFRTDAAGAVIEFIGALGNMKAEGESAIVAFEELGLKNIGIRDTLQRAAGAADLMAKAVNLGSEAIKTNAALNTEAQRAFATTASEIQKLKNEVALLGIKLFESIGPVIRETVIPVLKDVINAGKGVADQFRELPPEIQKGIFGVAAAAAAIGPVSYVIGSVATNVGMAISAFAKFGGVVQASIGQMYALETALAAGAGGATTASIAFATLTKALTLLAASPVVAVAALAVLGYELYQLTNATTAYVDAKNAQTEAENRDINTLYAAIAAANQRGAAIDITKGSVEQLRYELQAFSAAEREGFINQHKEAVAAAEARAKSNATFQATMASLRAESKKLADEQAELAQKFMLALKPADDLEKELQKLQKQFSNSQIIHVYGEEIIRAAENQRAHGIAVSDNVAKLDQLARAARALADAQREQEAETKRLIEEHKRLTEAFTASLKPADELEKTLQELRTEFSDVDIIKIYGDQIIDATAKQREHGFAISDNIALLEQMALAASGVAAAAAAPMAPSAAAAASTAMSTTVSGGGYRNEFWDPTPRATQSNTGISSQPAIPANIGVGGPPQIITISGSSVSDLARALGGGFIPGSMSAASVQANYNMGFNGSMSTRMPSNAFSPGAAFGNAAPSGGSAFGGGGGGDPTPGGASVDFNRRGNAPAISTEPPTIVTPAVTVEPTGGGAAVDSETQTLADQLRDMITNIPRVASGIPQTGLATSASRIFSEAVDKLVPAFNDFNGHVAAMPASGDPGGAMGLHLEINVNNEFHLATDLNPLVIRDTIIPEITSVLDTGLRGVSEEWARIIAARMAGLSGAGA